MKLITLILIGFHCISIGCVLQSKTIIDIPSDSIKIKSEKLKDYYSKSSKRIDSLEYQILFFEEFPSDFDSFNRLYGYDTSAMPLYDEAFDHIELFNRISCISNEEYYKKIISISIGGHWDADAVNYFQDGLRLHVLQKPDLIFKLLANKSDKEIFDFWFFYFDCPFPVKDIPQELEQEKDNNQKVYLLMKEAHLKAIESNRESE